MFLFCQFSWPWLSLISKFLITDGFGEQIICTHFFIRLVFYDIQQNISSSPVSSGTVDKTCLVLSPHSQVVHQLKRQSRDSHEGANFCHVTFTISYRTLTFPCTNTCQDGGKPIAIDERHRRSITPQ